MNDDRQEQSHVAAPVAGGRPSRRRIPAPVVYTIAILLLVLLIIILLPKAISFRKDVETRFQESLVEVKGNQGDVLEVSTYKNTAYFSESDKLDTTVLGITVPLGTTEAFLMVPVTYRFHVLLSDRCNREKRLGRVAASVTGADGKGQEGMARRVGKGLAGAPPALAI